MIVISSEFDGGILRKVNIQDFVKNPKGLLLVFILISGMIFSNIYLYQTYFFEECIIQMSLLIVIISMLLLLLNVFRHNRTT